MKIEKKSSKTLEIELIDTKLLNIDEIKELQDLNAKTAEILRIPNRGILKTGYYADVIIFNPNTFKDVADYKDAFKYADGLEYTIINGQLVIDQGKSTGNLKLLRM